MKDRIEEGRLISYMYDELTASERKEVEEFLAQHPEARCELDQLRAVRQLLRSADDKEVIAPNYLVEQARGVKPLYQSTWFRISFGIAASLALLMTAARLTGLEVTFQDAEMRISFNGSNGANPVVPSLTAPEIQQMINASLVSQNESMQAGWNDLKKLVDASMRQNMNQGMRLSPSQLTAMTQQVSQASQDQVSEYVSSMQRENLKQIQDYLKLSSVEQNQYIEGLLVDFAKYLQEQRKQDFQLLQTRVSSLEQNNNVFRNETEQILTSLISNVRQSKNAN